MSQKKKILPVLIYLGQEFGHRNEKTSKNIRRNRAFAMFTLDHVSHRPSKLVFIKCRKVWRYDIIYPLNIIIRVQETFLLKVEKIKMMR